MIGLTGLREVITGVSEWDLSDSEQIDEIIEEAYEEHERREKHDDLVNVFYELLGLRYGFENLTKEVDFSKGNVRGKMDIGLRMHDETGEIKWHYFEVKRKLDKDSRKTVKRQAFWFHQRFGVEDGFRVSMCGYQTDENGLVRDEQGNPIPYIRELDPFEVYEWAEGKAYYEPHLHVFEEGLELDKVA